MEQRRESNTICPNCGKQVTTGGGSMTSWIFGRTTCTCRTPSRTTDDKTPNPRTSLANRLNTKEQGKQVFGDSYEVLELIGEGGMAAVYKVRSKADGTMFAIKMLKPELARDPLAVKRFKYEVKSASKLTHPNLVTTYELGETKEGTPYFVMDFVEGCNLGVTISQEGHFEGSKALDIFIALCEAIEHAHEKGIIHRDIKPSNVLLTVQGLVKVVDFGIAKTIIAGSGTNTTSLTQTGEVFGSPLYMSPEQCMGENSDERSDIYSLGCLLYELLTGKPPFEGANPIKIIFKHLNEDPARIPNRGTNKEAERLYNNLESIVFCCLEKQPKNRFQSVHQLLGDLRSVRDGKPPLIARRSPAKRRVMLKKVAVIAGGLGLAAITTYATIHFVTAPGDKPPAPVSEGKKDKKDNEAFKQMITHFSNEIKANPNEEYWYIMRGTTYREAGDLMNSLMDFTMAINKNPKSARAYRERGWTYSRMDEWQKAAEDNSMAIQLDPKYGDAYIGRSSDYLALGLYSKAWDDASKAIQINPLNPTAFLNRASAQFSIGHYKEALVDSDKSIELNTAATHPRILRSRIKEKLGLYDEAIADLSFIIDKEPEGVPRIVERAYLYNKTGEFQKAIADADRARQLDPKHMGTYAARAVAFIGLNRDDDANREIDQGLSLQPDNCELFKIRGDIFMKHKDLDRAIEWYEKAIKSWQGYREAKDARAEAIRLKTESQK